MIVNHTAMAQLFGRTVSQYDKLRKRNAFLEQYRREPMFADGLEEFDSARSVILQAICICFSFCSLTDREWPYLSAATVSTCTLLFLLFSSLILLQFCLLPLDFPERKINTFTCFTSVFITFRSYSECCECSLSHLISNLIFRYLHL